MFFLYLLFFFILYVYFIRRVFNINRKLCVVVVFSNPKNFSSVRIEKKKRGRTMKYLYVFIFLQRNICLFGFKKCVIIK